MKTIVLEDHQKLKKSSEEVLSSEVDGEMVLMNLQTGQYFGLDEIATEIWSLLDDPNSVDDLVKKLMEVYEVKEEECRADTKTMLVQLINLKFLEV